MDNDPLTAAEQGNARAAHFRSLLRMQRAAAVAQRPAVLIGQARHLREQGAGADARDALDEALDVARRDPGDDAAWTSTHAIDYGINLGSLS